MNQELQQNAVICLSGGLDSTSLLLRLLVADCQVVGLSFRYGQRHAIELDRLQANLAYIRDRGHSIAWHLLDLSGLQPVLSSALTEPTRSIPLGHYEDQSMRQTFVPNRNAIFASIAYAAALSLAAKTSAAVSISLAVHRGDHAIYPDCRPEFYAALLQAFACGNWESGQISAYLPYLTWDKTQILADALENSRRLQLDFNLLMRQTCTSYDPDEHGRSHGLTGSDVERILAFHALGLEDPLVYRRPWEEVVSSALAISASQSTRSRLT